MQKTPTVASRPSRGLTFVLIAQFLSAFADNALILLAIALLRAHHAADWTIPLLQEVFVVSFIVLAPFVGPLSDARPKGQVMLLTNGIKLIGALALLAGLHPLLSYALVGVGAAAYSPAKYGILSELVPPEQLVRANALLESSTIVAILTGVVAGGWLADWSLPMAEVITAAVYALAGGVNLLIPALPAARPDIGFTPLHQTRLFFQEVRTLLRHPDGAFGVVGTSLFWGTGSALRFLLVAWIPLALLRNDNRILANLNAATAVGIILGAWLAARLIPRERVYRALGFGLMTGPLVILLVHLQNARSAALLLALIGLCGGAFVVPLNALVQVVGASLSGVGKALAIQNFFENGMMVLLVGLYSFSLKAGISLNDTALALGTLLTLSYLGLGLWRHRTAQSVIQTDQ